MVEPAQFRALTLEKWQQFSRVNIAFHPRLTILTGANGSGKTTLLRLLAQHRGWPSLLLATPAKNRVTGAIEFMARWFRGTNHGAESSVGSISYSNGVTSPLTIPAGIGSATYGIHIPNQQGVSCFFMPSHRQVFRYEPLSHIPAAKKTEQAAFEEVYSVGIQRHHGGGVQSSSFFMKSSLIGWAIQGYGVSDGAKVLMPADQAQRNAYEGFQETLRRLLPRTLGFDELEIRQMEIVFVCNGGKDEFLLETASGGIATIIDLAWQIFMFSRSAPGHFTVIIDEAENHLHPTLQRTLLPDLLEAFPRATFVVSTHSPLVVSSVEDAAVYVLRYGEDKKVASEPLDLQDKARNAMDILDEVLGVSSTLPVWVERKLAAVLLEFGTGQMTDDSFARLRQRLKDNGLENLLPEAIARAV